MWQSAHLQITACFLVRLLVKRCPPRVRFRSEGTYWDTETTLSGYIFKSSRWSKKKSTSEPWLIIKCLNKNSRSRKSEWGLAFNLLFVMTYIDILTGKILTTLYKWHLLGEVHVKGFQHPAFHLHFENMNLVCVLPDVDYYDRGCHSWNQNTFQRLLYFAQY